MLYVKKFGASKPSMCVIITVPLRIILHAFTFIAMQWIYRTNARVGDCTTVV